MAGETANSPEYVLKDFEGTYLGIMPSAESETGFGEIAVTISIDSLHMRIASGLGIEEEGHDMAVVHELSRIGVHDLFPTESEEEAQHLAQMRVFEAEGFKYVFMPTPDDIETAGPQLIVMTPSGDPMGLTVLFSPAQVAAGVHERALTELESEFDEHGATPRLDNGGRVPNETA